MSKPEVILESKGVYKLTPEQALRVGIIPAVYEGEPGKSPYIGEDGFWYTYDDVNHVWKKTDVYANDKEDYNNLAHRPSINGNELKGNKTAEELGFAKVATSGAYTDLTGRPTKVSDFTNDKAFQTQAEVAKTVKDAVSLVDARDNKAYMMAWGVNNEGYPTLTLKEES